MIQYIEANGLFLNLGLILMAEVAPKDDSKDAENVLILTTVLGTEITLEVDDAEAVAARITLLTQQTDAAVAQMQLLVAQASQQHTAPQPAKP